MRTATKRILIISDIYLKRCDSTVDFIRLFLEKCSLQGVSVNYLLPRQPCVEVLKRLEGSAFHYDVIPYWWNAKDSTKRNNFRIVVPILKKLRQGYSVAAFNFCDEFTALFVVLGAWLSRRGAAFIWHQHSEIADVPSKYSFTRYVSKLKLLSLVIKYICPVYNGQVPILVRRGIPIGKIRNLYNGVQLKDPTHNRGIRDVRDELGVDKQSIIIVTIGSLIQRKGMDTFIRAAKVVSDRTQSLRKILFLIVGTGPLKDELSTLVGALNMQGQIRLLGERSDVWDLLVASDMFVLCSRKEPFGLVNIEAMAAHKPVVASNVGGISEIVSDSRSGYLVQPEDVDGFAALILRLCENEKMRMEFGNCGRQIAEEKFSIDTMVQSYLNVYLCTSERGKPCAM